MAFIKKFIFDLRCLQSVLSHELPRTPRPQPPFLFQIKSLSVERTLKLPVLVCISEPQLGSWRQGQWRDFFRMPHLLCY